MQFDSVQGAKAEIFEDVFGFQSVPVAASAGNNVPLFAPKPDTSAYRNVVDGRKRRRYDARDLIALGVLPPEGHNRNPDSFKLGIFVQRTELLNHPLVQAAQARARGEARVIYTGPVSRRAAVNPGRHRPLRIGGSIGHYRVTAGSIGCICIHRDGGGIGILSNNHILADTNKADLGDIILQPGRKDGGRRQEADSRVATLFSFERIAFEVDARNLVDCAFAALMGGVRCDSGTAHCPETGEQHPVKSLPAELLPDDEVWKVGRTTGRTTGRVVAVNVDNVVVAMGAGTGQRLARFDGQISIDRADGHFSEGGDSGAVIWTRDGSPAALLFAGTERGGATGYGLTYANPIEAVLDALDLEIHTGV